MKRLLRSRRHNVITGVCGGLADYLNVDVAIVRILTIVATMFTGGAVIIAYVIASIVIPDEGHAQNGSFGQQYKDQWSSGQWPNQNQSQNGSQAWPNQNQSQNGSQSWTNQNQSQSSSQSWSSQSQNQSQSQSQWDNYSDINKGMDDWKTTPKGDPDKSKRIIGAVLITIGALFFLKEVIHWWDMRIIVPAALVIIGGAIIYKGRRGSV